MTVLAESPESRAAVPADWEPRIVALVCNWCTYAGADMAGTARRTYAPNVRIVRFLCTGRLDPLFLLKAFEEGADGVLVSGCHPGDCHYVQGNYLARRRFTVFSALMDFLGLDRRRLHFAWVSASEGVKWSRVVDEVTEAVREAGPLGTWAAPPVLTGRSAAGQSPPARGGGSLPALGRSAARQSPPARGGGSLPALGRSAAGQSPPARGGGSLPEAAELSAFSLPEPGPEPRAAPSAEESEAIAARLRETAAALLAEGEASVVLGYTAGSLPGQMVPLFATRPEDAALLDWNERCASNLTVYLPEAVKRHREGRVAVVVKSCDAKAVAGLQRESQLTRDDVLLLGVPCAGSWQNGRLALKCYGCAEEVSPLADRTITAGGVEEGAVPSGAERPIAPDPRDEQVAALDALPAEERRAFWQDQLERCLRCYACRAVCPLCYCSTCISDKHRPQWIPLTVDGPGNTAWNVARAMHLAGRCVGCDECTRVCPADIRLDLLNRRLVQEIDGRFGYRAGEDAGVPAPLTTFSPSDPDEFL